MHKGYAFIMVVVGEIINTNKILNIIKVPPLLAALFRAAIFFARFSLNINVVLKVVAML